MDLSAVGMTAEQGTDLVIDQAFDGVGVMYQGNSGLVGGDLVKGLGGPEITCPQVAQSGNP